MGHCSLQQYNCRERTFFFLYPGNYKKAGINLKLLEQCERWDLDHSTQKSAFRACYGVLSYKNWLNARTHIWTVFMAKYISRTAHCPPYDIMNNMIILKHTTHDATHSLLLVENCIRALIFFYDWGAIEIPSELLFHNSFTKTLCNIHYGTQHNKHYYKKPLKVSCSSPFPFIFKVTPFRVNRLFCEVKGKVMPWLAQESSPRSLYTGDGGGSVESWLKIWMAGRGTNAI